MWVEWKDVEATLEIHPSLISLLQRERKTWWVPTLPTQTNVNSEQTDITNIITPISSKRQGQNTHHRRHIAAITAKNYY